MTLTYSDVSVDGYFQSWLHCCEICTDSREPRGFENNSNFLLAEVDGWHFCFVYEVSDLTFSWSLTETFAVLRGRTYSLLDLSSRALNVAGAVTTLHVFGMGGWECGCQCPQRMTTSFTAIFLVLWHFLLVGWQKSLIPCDCSLLKMFSVFLLSWGARDFLMVL